LNKGDTFGELALISDAFRSASVQALTNVSLWGINRGNFCEAIRTANEANFAENLEFLNSVPYFSELEERDKEFLAISFKACVYKPDDRIINEGDAGSLFFIIKTGAVSCSIGSSELR
jgi:CRP-like cAMP-binding protein